MARKIKEMTDFEKTVSLIAGQIYAHESVRRISEMKDGDSYSEDELIADCHMSAFSIVEGVVECTRRE